MSFFGWLKKIFGGYEQPVASTEAPVKQKKVSKKQRREEAAKKREETVEKKDAFMTKLRKDLVQDEGEKYKIYLDSEGLPTFGIGHLVKPADPEWGKPVGTKVSKERVQEAFDADVAIAVRDAETLFTNFWNLPEEVRLIATNMSFNLGRRRLSRFKKFRAAVNEGNWKTAAAEMKDSRWYGQVGNRSKRLYDRMMSV